MISPNRSPQIPVPANYGSDGISEDDFFVVELEKAESMITCSQADQALCDEAGSGRIHGEGSLLMNSSGLCWVSQKGDFLLHLQEGYRFYTWMRVHGDFNRFVPGEPRIDYLQQDGRLCNANLFIQWNTLFQYLRMAALSAVARYPYPEEVNQTELNLARILCREFQLSGSWGGRNRISNCNAWYEDKTVSYLGDWLWYHESVCDVERIPRSQYELKFFDDGCAIILPVTILRRSNFLAPRRVFWLSEDTLYPIRRGLGVSSTVHVTLSLPHEGLLSNDQWLCYPGGAAAVEICDLAPLRDRSVDITILDKQGKSGWDFAMRFAARLRRENIKFSVTFLHAHEHKDLTMNVFLQYLGQWQLRIPPELSSEYQGDLTEWMTRSPEVLIPGTLNAGEIVHLAGALMPEIILHLAVAVKNGCWNGNWKAAGDNLRIVIFAEKYNLTLCRGRGISVQHLSWQTATLKLEEAERAIAGAQIVILASAEMTRDSRTCEAVIKYCVNHEIGVIALTEADNNSSLLQRVAAKTYFSQVRHSHGKKTFYLVNQTENFGIRFAIDSNGALDAMEKLSAMEIAKVQPDPLMSIPENGVAEIQRLRENDQRSGKSDDGRDDSTIRQAGKGR